MNNADFSRLRDSVWAPGPVAPVGDGVRVCCDAATLPGRNWDTGRCWGSGEARAELSGRNISTDRSAKLLYCIAADNKMLSKRAALAERLGSIGSWQKGLVSKRKNKGFFIFFY